MEKRWCTIYIEKPWPGWLHSDPVPNNLQRAACSCWIGWIARHARAHDALKSDIHLRSTEI